MTTKLEQAARSIDPQAWANADEWRRIGKEGPWAADMDEADYARLADAAVAPSLQRAREVAGA
jgi:hypothetical protein